MSFISPSYTVESYTGTVVDTVWERAEPFVMQAVLWSRGELSILTLREAIRSGHAQLWTFEKKGKLICVMLTELLVFAQKKSCNILALAGKETKNIWFEVQEYLEIWLRENGVQEFYATSRRGVARHLRKLGFTEAATVMVYKVKGVTI